MDKNQISNLLTEDMSYLLGLIVGRGTITSNAEDRKIVIDFPFKNLQVETPQAKDKINIYLHLANSVDKIIERIERLGFTVKKYNDPTNKKVSISLSTTADDMKWQVLIFLLNGKRTNYHSFRIPKAIFQADKEKQKEFLRGYFDVTGHIRESNRYIKNEHRVYLEIDHKNWFLVIDICKILGSVEVPTQTINFGHPNFRVPNKLQSKAWEKEHQVKIYANRFLKIGSYLEHKQKMLSELAKLNGEEVGAKDPCDIMQKITKPKEKQIHPEEKSEKLPDFIRGKHFNGYRDLFQLLLDNDKVKPYE